MLLRQIVTMQPHHFKKFFALRARETCHQSVFLSQTKTISNMMPKMCEDPFPKNYSEVIDVRTPSEFLADHIPGAVNLPILDRDQRHEVGLLYSQNQFDARKLGAQIISKNIADYIATYFSSKPKSYAPLIYCWRGGQRSHSLGIVLSQIGYDVHVLRGGYKLYRELVRQYLSELPKQFYFNVITGLTGSGKTLLLEQLDVSGEQVLDLEQLANHRGSLLGLLPGNDQPSQKYFESLLAEKLYSFDANRVVWLESESRKIGQRCIPPDLFSQTSSPKNVFRLEAPIEERVKFTMSTYSPWTIETVKLKYTLRQLSKYHGKETLKNWLDLVDSCQYTELVGQLLARHYDKGYERSQGNKFSSYDISNVKVLTTTNITVSNMSNLAKAIKCF